MGQFKTSRSIVELQKSDYYFELLFTLFMTHVKKYTMRDVQLDNYRALVMVYIICFIHVCYWLGLGEPTINSLSLIEMPAIFFISGAAMTFSYPPQDSIEKNIRKKSIFQVAVNRFKRVLLPYYIYASVMLLGITVLGGLMARPDVMDISRYTVSDWYKVLTFTALPQVPFVAHLWFIAPYLILSCTFAIHPYIINQLRLQNSKWLYVLCNIFLFAMVQLVTNNELIREVFCYNVFMLLGFCYYKQLKIKWILLSIVVSFLLLVIQLYWGEAFLVPMQANKFPPNFLFLTYSCLALGGISILLTYIQLPQLRILQLWNERGYTMYLYQNVAYAIVSFGGLSFLKIYLNDYPVVLFALVALILFFLSIAISLIAYPFEQIVIRRFRILIN